MSSQHTKIDFHSNIECRVTGCRVTTGLYS